MDTTIVFVSDLHVGHPNALCPEKWELPDGQQFSPSPLQKIIREHWLDTCAKIAQRRKKRRVIVCLVGDATEGVHHGSTQVISARLDTQADMAAAVLRELLDNIGFAPRRGDLLRCVVGSRAHDGDGGSSLNNVVQRLPHNFGLDIVHGCWLARVHTVLFDVAHTPRSGPGTRYWTRESQFRSWLTSLRAARLDSGETPPRYVIRAHKHDYLRVDIPNALGEVGCTGIILPPWKGKDEYVYEKMPEVITSIGAVVVDVDGDGATRDAHWRVRLVQDQVEDL